MNIVQCQCGQRFVAQPHLAGQQVPCPACGATLSIPAPTVQPAQLDQHFVVECACGQRFQAAATLAGQQVPCPSCGGPISVPRQSPSGNKLLAAPTRHPQALASSTSVAQSSASSDAMTRRVLTFAYCVGGGAVVILIALLAYSTIGPRIKAKMSWAPRSMPEGTQEATAVSGSADRNSSAVADFRAQMEELKGKGAAERERIRAEIRNQAYIPASPVATQRQPESRSSAAAREMDTVPVVFPTQDITPAMVVPLYGTLWTSRDGRCEGWFPAQISIRHERTGKLGTQFVAVKQQTAFRDGGFVVTEFRIPTGMNSEDFLNMYVAELRAGGDIYTSVVPVRSAAPIRVTVPSTMNRIKLGPFAGIEFESPATFDDGTPAHLHARFVVVENQGYELVYFGQSHEASDVKTFFAATRLKVAGSPSLVLGDPPRVLEAPDPLAAKPPSQNSETLVAGLLKPRAMAIAKDVFEAFKQFDKQCKERLKACTSPDEANACRNELRREELQLTLKLAEKHGVNYGTINELVKESHSQGWLDWESIWESVMVFNEPFSGGQTAHGLKVDSSLPMDSFAQFCFGPAPHPIVLVNDTVWNLQSGEKIGRIPVKVGFKNTWIVLSPSGKHVAVEEGTGVDVYDVPTGKFVQRMPCAKESSQLDHLVLIDDTRLIARWRRDSVEAWEIGKNKPIHRIEVPGFSGTAVSSDGEYLLEGSRVYRVSTGRIVAQLETPVSEIADGSMALGFTSAAFSADLQEVAAIFRNFRFVLWSNRGKILLEHDLSKYFGGIDGMRMHGDRGLIHWLPDKKGWLIGGKVLLQRDPARVAWLVRTSMLHQPKPVQFVAPDHVAIARGIKQSEIVTVAIPWERINAASSADLPLVTNVNVRAME